MAKEKIGILVGPRSSGSNMAAIAEACLKPDFPAQIDVVVAPQHDASAARRAEALGLRVSIADPAYPHYAELLLDALKNCRWVCLSGYLRLLPEKVLRAFPRRVLNIHPALLPKFGGKGMYGSHVHAAVLAAGESESGCTVHLVTERYDEGEIVLQRTVPVLDGDDVSSLAARVMEQERIAYADALRQMIESS